MPTRYTVVCEDRLSREVKRLARENAVTEEEVLHQLITLGLDHLDEEAHA